MKLEDFDYPLPTSLIAQHPSSGRGDTALMVLHRRTGTIEHRSFGELLHFLLPDDLLVLNNTRVLPARLIGKKETGGKVELLLIPSWNGAKTEWKTLVKGSGKIKTGTRIQFDQGVEGEIGAITEGKADIRFFSPDPIEVILHKIGHIPLPPYIKREDQSLDRERYQTVFAEKDGAIAAPTAGLHFTPSFLQSLKKSQIRTATLTLHVGIGTFTPVKASQIENHTMEGEWAEISKDTAGAIDETKRHGGKIVAVGTTTVRTLESFSDQKGGVRPGKGMTSLFIHPPYRFQVVGALITNFHLPKSTLIMLVSAFAGKKFLMEAYQEAIQKKYRFYSYGDAMLIL